MVKKLFSKKINTTKHNPNRNFRKKNLCKSNSDAGLPQVKNWKLPYFKIGFLFMICLALGIALTACSENSPPNSNFISKWRVTSGDQSIQLPLVENGRYDFTVDWGDGTTDTVASWDATEKTHTYGEPGDYTVTVTGTIVGWAFSNESEINNASFRANARKLTAVSQWGNLHLGNTAGYQFYGAENLNITASDAPFLHDGDNTYTTDLSGAFARATNLRGNLNNWDVGNVTDMFNMFSQAHAFNEPIGDWDVGNVTDMSFMFRLAEAFNQDIGDWDVSSVTTMNTMFFGAIAFNRPIGDWDVSSVTIMRHLFLEAHAFDQPLGNWHDKLGNVTIMTEMFSEARAFNQDISDWDVSSVDHCRSFAENSGLAASNQPTFTICDSSAD